MNEIIQRLVDRTGLPENKAQDAVNVVIGFLKEWLPEPFASQIDRFLDGFSGMANTVDNLGGNLAGMFGRRE